MKATLTLILFGLIGLNTMAQVPRAFKYQAVARNTTGEVLANKTVSFRIGILGGSATGTAVYTETHTGKTTNSFGLVDLEIGKGAPVTGTFSGISWGTSDYFLKVEMDPNGGTSYQAMGTSQLLSVPYALFARDVENNADGDADATNELQKLTISGTVLTLDKGGQSVILPSGGTSGDNWGTQVVVTDPTLAGNGAPATPLKIADNGVTSAKIQDGTLVTADLADNAVTSQKIADGAIVTADLADQTVSTAKLGNLAVSADKIQNGAVTTDKIANGAVTGVKIAQAGASDGQVLKWKSSSSSWSPGDDATGGGGLTLPYLGTTSIPGDVAFKIVDSGGGSAIYGHSSLLGASGDNFGVKGESGAERGIGVIGISTSYKNLGVYGEGKTGVSGFGSQVGVRGVGDIGVDATSGSPGGYGVRGTASSTNSVGVYGKSSSPDGYGLYGEAPVYGVYAKSTGNTGRALKAEATGTGSIGVWGVALGDNSTGVYGQGANYDFYAAGPGVNYGEASSIRWKSNIIPIPDPLGKILAVRGVYFDWDQEHGGQHDVGMIAEEVGKVMPEIVVYESNGVDANGMDYSKITPLLLEAIKAQQAEIERLKEKLEQLEKLVGASAQK